MEPLTPETLQWLRETIQAGKLARFAGRSFASEAELDRYAKKRGIAPVEIAPSFDRERLRERLIALKGVGERLADQILAVFEGTEEPA